MMRFLVAGALAFAGAVSSAQAATITFDDVLADSPGSSPGIRISGGFVFTPGQHSHVIAAPDQGDAFNGTQYLALDDVLGPDPVTFSQLGGGAFSLLSFDIGEWCNCGPGGNFARQIDVVGVFAGGGTPNHVIFSVDGLKPAFETFTLDSTWTNLSSVTLKGINGAGPQNSFGLDNVVVNPASVPEPGTLSLLGLGAASLIRRRRR